MSRKIRRALVSVSDKTDIEKIGAVLAKHGVEILSTGGTAKKLQEVGISVTEVSKFTGFPEMMGGRVKTLHPKIHGGLLFVRGDETHETEAEQNGILPIDMVICNLYPFQQTVAKEGCTLADAIENIDIGGPSMTRSAAKNNKFVTILTNPADYQRVIDEMDRTGGAVSEETNFDLAVKAFGMTAAYDCAIWEYLAGKKDQLVKSILLGPAVGLAYAESRDRNPAHFLPNLIGPEDSLAFSRFETISGSPAYITVADHDTILNILCALAETFRRWQGNVPYIAICGKHGSPCGLAIDWKNPMTAIEKAIWGDPRAVMGGEFICNFPITDKLGQRLFAPNKQKNFGRDKVGLDLICVPGISDSALELLGKREKRKVMTNVALSDPQLPPEEWTLRAIRGGYLEQRAACFLLTPDNILKWAGKPLTKTGFETLLVAWVACWRTVSNTTALAKNRQLIGLVGGQQDRVQCTRFCFDRAVQSGHDTTESIFATDGFIPYPNSEAPIDIKNIIPDLQSLLDQTKKSNDPHEQLRLLDRLRALALSKDNRESSELMRDGGCIGGIVPYDGQNKDQTVRFFKDAGMRVAFVAPEHRGFYGH